MADRGTPARLLFLAIPAVLVAVGLLGAASTEGANPGRSNPGQIVLRGEGFQARMSLQGFCGVDRKTRGAMCTGDVKPLPRERELKRGVRVTFLLPKRAHRAYFEVRRIGEPEQGYPPLDPPIIDNAHRPRGHRGGRGGRVWAFRIPRGYARGDVLFVGARYSHRHPVLTKRYELTSTIYGMPVRD